MGHVVWRWAIGGRRSVVIIHLPANSPLLHFPLGTLSPRTSVAPCTTFAGRLLLVDIVVGFQFGSASVVGFSTFQRLSCHDINTDQTEAKLIVIASCLTFESHVRGGHPLHSNRPTSLPWRPPPTPTASLEILLRLRSLPPSPKLLVPGHPTNRTYSTYRSWLSMCWTTSW